MAPNSADPTSTKMTHRFLGNSGLLVSKLSLGSWMDYNETYTVDAWYDMMKIAFQHGVNLYDTAERDGIESQENSYFRVVHIQSKIFVFAFLK
ncbi:Voltage-gated potassium channel subunit beta-3 [Phytophthora citrophthora]|uniref:Voltage-gated potassium channel subunit beta-3 n=1 Tax=Phytophthora citrophthora TaxID=4793 RepID=A0AAD9LF91_9STRA|nr:Voltage-gated potassium channel subunit beta-3 [Phytophthora citrophthora]